MASSTPESHESTFALTCLPTVRDDAEFWVNVNNYRLQLEDENMKQAMMARPAGVCAVCWKYKCTGIVTRALLSHMSADLDHMSSMILYDKRYGTSYAAAVLEASSSKKNVHNL